MTYSESMLMFVSPLTPLHAGVGRAGGVVDLPVQRDVLGFPIIYASSLKGALKSHAYLSGREKLAKALFGPEPDESDESKYLAPVSLTDAYPLLIPARSAKGNPVMITSSFLIRTCLGFVDLALAVRGDDARSTSGLSKLRELLSELASHEPQCGKVVALSNKPVVSNVGGRDVVIINGELLEVSRILNTPALKELSSISGALPESFKDAIPDKVVILNDDDALKLIEKSLIRLTRVRLDRERKVVSSGGLWTEEYLPHGTLLVSAVLYSSVRARNISWESKEGLNIGKVKEALGIRGECGYVILGGKESVGKGISRICFIS